MDNRIRILIEVRRSACRGFAQPVGEKDGKRSDGSESVIHAEPENVWGEAVVDASQHIAAVFQAHVEILRFRGPVRRQADFDASAKSPAEVALRFTHARE